MTTWNERFKEINKKNIKQVTKEDANKLFEEMREFWKEFERAEHQNSDDEMPEQDKN